jgi:phage gp46-like protein
MLAGQRVESWAAKLAEKRVDPSAHLLAAMKVVRKVVQMEQQLAESMAAWLVALSETRRVELWVGQMVATKVALSAA